MSVSHPEIDKLFQEPGLLSPGVKPTRPVTIDWNNPLTRGLVGFWILNEKGGLSLDVTDGRACPIGGGASFRSKSEGLALTFADGDGSYVDCSDHHHYDCTDKISIVAKCRVASQTDNRAVISKGLGGSATHAWDLKYHGTPNAVRASLRNSTAQTNIDGVTSPSTVTPSTFGMGWDDVDNNAYIYLNGKQDGSGTFAGPIQTNTTAVRIGAPAGWAGTGEFHGDIYYVALWNRRISAKEHMEMHRNPYQVLKPLNVMAFPVPTAAGGAFKHYWSTQRAGIIGAGI